MRGLAFYNNDVRTAICEGWHFIITMLARLYVKVGILLTCGKYLHDPIISLRGDGWTHKTSLSPPFFIEMFVPSKEIEQYLSVRRIDIACFCHFVMDFGTVVFYFFFHFIVLTRCGWYSYWSFRACVFLCLKLCFCISWSLFHLKRLKLFCIAHPGNIYCIALSYYDIVFVPYLRILLAPCHCTWFGLFQVVFKSNSFIVNNSELHIYLLISNCESMLYDFMHMPSQLTVFLYKQFIIRSAWGFQIPFGFRT